MTRRYVWRSECEDQNEKTYRSLGELSQYEPVAQ